MKKLFTIALVLVSLAALAKPPVDSVPFSTLTPLIPTRSNIVGAYSIDIIPNGSGGYLNRRFAKEYFLLIEDSAKYASKRYVDSIQTAFLTRLILKMNYTDTASMLANYKFWAQGYITSSALSPYLTSSTAASSYVPLSRTITINGASYDLSANRSWTIGGGGALSYPYAVKNYLNGYGNWQALNTDSLTEGAGNLFWTATRFDTRLATKTTDNLSEGTTNLYFTNARARAAVSNGYGLNYSAGVFSVDTAVIQKKISAGTGIAISNNTVYNSITNNNQLTNGAGYIADTTNLSGRVTTNVTAVNNLQSTKAPLASPTFTGVVAFPGGQVHTLGGQNFFANSSTTHFIYTATNGISFNNQANTATVATLSNAGAFNAAGTVTGSNLSGTNTGDETTTRINAIYGFTITNPSLKVNVSDTSAMLSVYLRKSDTAAMLSPYARTANVVTLTGTQTLTNKTMTSPAYTSQALTDGATITWNSTSGTIATVTLAGNRTLSITNAIANAYYQLTITQDGTGSRTITWPTIKWKTGTAPTLTTAAGSKDIITLWFDGTSYYGNYGLDYK